MIFAYDYDDYEHECFQCDKNYKRIVDSQEWLQSLIDQLYSKQDLDVVKFEDHLEELCCSLDVKIPNNKIMIQRKEC